MYYIVVENSNAKERKVFLPSIHHTPAESIEHGLFRTQTVKWNNTKFYKNDLFPSYAMAKSFQRTCGLDFPLTIVQKIEPRDPRVI